MTLRAMPHDAVRRRRGIRPVPLRFPTYNNILWYGTRRRPVRFGTAPNAHRNQDKAGRFVAGRAPLSCLQRREKHKRLLNWYSDDFRKSVTISQDYTRTDLVYVVVVCVGSEVITAATHLFLNPFFRWQFFSSVVATARQIVAGATLTVWSLVRRHYLRCGAALRRMVWHLIRHHTNI